MDAVLKMIYHNLLATIDMKRNFEIKFVAILHTGITQLLCRVGFVCLKPTILIKKVFALRSFLAKLQK